jgi:transcriptional regulator GlxA family with amidase domain
MTKSAANSRNAALDSVVNWPRRQLWLHGMKVVPDYDLDTCPQLDILIIPGGWGAIREMNNERLVNWIGTRSRQVDTVTSVCTGALLLGKAGLLDGKRATTHWRFLDRMQELFPRVTVERQVHFVEEGVLFTSAGISAGIERDIILLLAESGIRSETDLPD